MPEAVAARVLRAAFGSGSDISAANPLPVTNADVLEHGVAAAGTNTTPEDTTKDFSHIREL